jgi:hypothetical protein
LPWSIIERVGPEPRKRLHILDARRGPVEITEVSDVIRALRGQKKFAR